MDDFISLLMIICYIIFFLLCNGGITVHSRTQNRSSDCASSCGHLLDIRYPFRLKTDPAHCGSKYFDISCDADQPYFEYKDGKYYIRDISYFYQTINVVDPVYSSDRSSCGLPSYPLDSFYSSDGPVGTCGTQQISANFLSCTKRIQSPNYFSCMSGNGSFTYVLVGYSFVVTDLEPSCKYVNMTLVSDVDLQSGTSRQALDVLQEGFQLCWYRESLSTLFGRCVKASLRYFDDQVKNSKESREQVLVSDTYWYWGLVDILRRYVRHMKLPLISPLVKSELFFLQCMGENVMELRALGYVNKKTAEAVVDSIIVAFILFQISLLITVLLLISRVICMPLVIFVFLAHKYWGARMPFDNVERFLRYQQTLAPSRYSYTEIIAITRNFREKLGEGGFGSVFKGITLNNMHVAVKILGSSQLGGEEFINEVSTLCKVNHKNIVRLIGYCSEGSTRALVYEYMPNGSLDKHIFSNRKINSPQPFSWEKLKEIALGVARGIDYLHRECDMQIIHFDIKPHNILLDNNFVPKVSDFGLAKLYPKDFSLVSVSIAKGTAGYIAPELLSRNFGYISDKSDVYSFGMLLLEMSGGRRNSNPDTNRTNDQEYYPMWMYDQLVRYKENKISNKIDNTEAQLGVIGLWCIQIKPSDRPPMSKVVEMLATDGLDSLPLPPKPFFSCSRPDSINHIAS